MEVISKYSRLRGAGVEGGGGCGVCDVCEGGGVLVEIEIHR